MNVFLANLQTMRHSFHITMILKIKWSMILRRISNCYCSNDSSVFYCSKHQLHAHIICSGFIISSLYISIRIITFVHWFIITWCITVIWWSITLKSSLWFSISWISLSDWGPFEVSGSCVKDVKQIPKVPAKRPPCVIVLKFGTDPYHLQGLGDEGWYPRYDIEY